MRTLLSVAAILMSVAGLPAAAHASSSIDIPSNGSGVSSWGPSSGQSYGQVFSALDTVLTNYTLNIGSSSGFSYVSQIFAWNGSGVTGSALFTSGIQNTPLSRADVTFNPGAFVTNGSQYIALVTNQPGGNPFGGTGTGSMGTGTASSGFVFTGNAPVQGNSWACTTGCGISAKFHADFASAAPAVPEPATWAMMILGMGAIGAIMRRRVKVSEVNFTNHVRAIANS